MDDLLTALDKVLAERKTASPESSYVAALNAEGLNKILEKVGEEATEVILAAKDVAESGDSEAAAVRTMSCLGHQLYEAGRTTGRSLTNYVALSCKQTDLKLRFV